MKQLVFLITVITTIPFLATSLAPTAFALESAAAGLSNRPTRQATEEEKIVRAAYMKLTAYSRAGDSRGVRRGRARSSRDRLRFELGDIRTGPIEEIYDRPYGELVTKPTGKVIQVLSHSEGPTPDREHVLYSPAWIESHYNVNLAEDWENTTVRQVLYMLGHEFSDVGKYTSYEVTAHLDGSVRTYRAMVLYHGPLQSEKTPSVEFLDNIVGQSALTRAFREQRPPIRSKRPQGNAGGRLQRETIGHFVDKGLVKQPYAGFSTEPQQSDKSEATDPVVGIASSCPPGTLADMGGYLTGWCCDTLSMSCCLPYDSSTGWCDDITCGYPDCSATPAPGGGGGSDDTEVCKITTKSAPEQTLYRTDSTHHPFGWGYHEVQSMQQGRCEYFENCDVSCAVEAINVQAADYGFPSTCHQVRWDSRSHTATGPAPSCSGTVGAGWKACLFCACFVEISFELIGVNYKVTTDGFWTFEHIASHTCKEGKRL